jgi:hypothetical protein
MRLIRGIVAVATMAAAVVGGTSVPSFATDQSCVGVNMQVGTDTCSDVITSQSSAAATESVSVTSTSANDVDITSSTTVLAYVKATGATAAQLHNKTFKLANARCLNTSYKNIHGQEVWHVKCYAKGKVFHWGGDHFWHDGICWNKVTGLPSGNAKPKAAKQVTGTVKIVKSFSFKSTSKASVSDHVSAAAKAWANAYDSRGNQTCHSEASATGNASFYAEAFGSASGTVLTTVQASARAAAHGNLSLKLQGKTLTAIHASTKASASGTATAQASAKATCSQPPPPPHVPAAPSISAQAQACVKVGEATGVVTGSVFNNDTAAHAATVTVGSKSTSPFTVSAGGSAPFTLSGFAPGTYTVVATMPDINKSATTQVTVNQCATPPPAVPPSVIDVTQLNDVDAGATSPNFCATVTLPSGHTGTLFFVAKLGSFAPSSVAVTSASSRLCSTYTAPADSGSSSDTVHVKVVDNTTGLSDQSADQTFPVNPPPVRP